MNRTAENGQRAAARVDGSTTDRPEHSKLTELYRAELSYLAELGGDPRIVNTGGGCTALEADLGADEDPHGDLYLIATSAPYALAHARDEITEWTVQICSRHRDDDETAWATHPLDFTEAYRTALASLHADENPVS